ncbi:MAG TPA: ion channel [Chthoniobacterales bacterium]
MPRPISLRSGQVEFVKINTQREWRDLYQWLLGLTWPKFAGVAIATCIGLNVLFAGAYAFGGDCVEGMKSGHFLPAFFFSVQTLATVGYGHMYPRDLYGHVVSTIEIITGMFYMALVTGLIFVRFSRPRARIVFSKCLVIAPFNGRSTLMARVANLRHYNMVEAEFRIMLTRDEPWAESGEMFRHFYQLPLHFDRLVAFPAALTLRHTIDERSPLHGATPESLEACRATFVISVVGIETIIPAAVQTYQDYSSRDVLFGRRFADIYTEGENRTLTVDYGRIDETEPATMSGSAPQVSSTESRPTG